MSGECVGGICASMCLYVYLAFVVVLRRADLDQSARNIFLSLPPSLVSIDYFHTLTAVIRVLCQGLEWVLVECGVLLFELSRLRIRTGQMVCPQFCSA